MKFSHSLVLSILLRMFDAGYNFYNEIKKKKKEERKNGGVSNLEREREREMLEIILTD